jgi:pimeloyl-ACP methyl ester carboxylesterase
VIGEADLRVEGEGTQTVLMVHGWPDTYRLWDAQVDSLKARYRCVRFTLPGFDAVIDPAKVRRTYTLPELVAFLKEVIEQVSPDQKVILMLHDWGCLFGYELYMRHPELVAKIVGVDIGDRVSLARSLKPAEKMMILAYQLTLAAAWKIGGRFGDWLTRYMARALRCPSEQGPITSAMNYPYYMTWFGGVQSYRKESHEFTPLCPMLFIYGRRKPLMFHARSWAEALGKREGNLVVPFDTGHWVMTSQPERFNQVVVEWLDGGE